MARRSPRPQSVNPASQAAQTVIDLLEKKQYAQAHSRLEVLRRQFPKNSQLMALHGDALRHLKRTAEAAKAYQAAHEAGQKDPRLFFNLATCLITENQAEAALPHIEHLLTLNPKQANVLSLKGDALRKTNQPEQARELYRQAVALDGTNPKLYAAMAHLDVFDADSPVFEILPKALEDEQLEYKERATFLATLAKAYLDIGEDAQAFDYYQQANQLMDQNLAAINYELESLLTRTRQRFTPSLFEQLSPAGDNGVPQIIIAGMSRSGKSLVESLFRGVKGVRLAGEELILSDYKKELLQAYNQSTEAWLADQSPESNQQAAAGYLEKLQAHVDEDQRDSIQITTIPGDLWNLGLIGLWLPNVPIVFCVRNFLDLGITGYFQQYDIPEGYRYSYDLHQLGRQIACSEKVMEHWAQVLPNPIYLVDYEALVADPQQVMDNLLAELGLEREKPYEQVVDSNTNLVDTLSPIVSVDAPMPITDRFVGFHQRFQQQLQPLVKGYHTIVDEFPRQEPPATFPHPLPELLLDQQTVEAEPSTTVDFTWEIPGQITIIDNGAQLLKQDNINELMSLGSFGLVAFDPAADIDLSPSLQAQPGLQYVPQALLGTGEPAQLYACLDAQYNSTLAPLPTDQLPVRLQQSMSVLAQLPVATYALDAIDGLDSLDWLLLSAQHDNTRILQQGQNTLAHTLLVQVDLWQQPLYAQQSGMAELSQWAQQQGFRLYALINNQLAQGMVERDDLITQPTGTELQRSTALFVPDAVRMRTLSDAQKLKLAFIFDAVFKAHDYCYELLREVAPQLGENYLKARGYFDRRPNGPSYQEILDVEAGLATGEYATQGQLINQWARQYPLDPLVRGLCAQLASYQNQAGMAIYHMNKALALAPDDLSLRLNSVQILLRAGMWWEAVHDAQTLHTHLPHHPKVVALYAQALAAHPAPNVDTIATVLNQLDELIAEHKKHNDHKAHLQKTRKALAEKIL